MRRLNDRPLARDRVERADPVQRAALTPAALASPQEGVRVPPRVAPRGHSNAGIARLARALLQRDALGEVPVGVAVKGGGTGYDLDWDSTPKSVGLINDESGTLRTIYRHYLGLEIAFATGLVPSTQEQVTLTLKQHQQSGKPEKADELRRKFFVAQQRAVIKTLNVKGMVDAGLLDEAEFKRRVEAGEPVGGPQPGRYKNVPGTDPAGNAQPGKTFCVTYAADVVQAMGAYLPIRWWSSFDEVSGAVRGGSVLDKILSGDLTPVTKAKWNSADEKERKDKKYVSPGLENTFQFMANGMVTWMEKWGGAYGWRKVIGKDAQERMEKAQEAANDGRVVVALARGIGMSGHVNVVLAEDPRAKALRIKGKMVAPLQSQAGPEYLESGHLRHPGHSVTDPTKEDAYKGYDWWDNAQHKDGNFWVFTGGRSQDAVAGPLD